MLPPSRLPCLVLQSFITKAIKVVKTLTTDFLCTTEFKINNSLAILLLELPRGEKVRLSIFDT